MMRARGFALSVLLVSLFAAAAQARDLLTRHDLVAGRYARPVDVAAYLPAADARVASNRFEGRLRLSGQPSTRTLLALPEFLDASDAKRARTLPQDLDMAFVQFGDALIPATRGPIASTHPWWEFVFETGRVWDEPGDEGATRAAIPFALVQKNANCTLNGVLTFLFRNDGIVSRAALQIGSETCRYLQIDMWGMLAARYLPGAVADRDALIAADRAEMAMRLPVRPIGALADDFPGIIPAKFAIGAAAGRSVHGVIVNGIHYRGDCQARYGLFPYCDQLDIPSYSVAKSAVAGIGLMRMERLHPGVKDQLVSRHARASGCMTDRWQGVTFLHLLDMATGQYDSPAYMADEDAARVRAFFGPETHAQRLAFACEAYPRRQAPGERWVYHTSDTYLLGTVLQTALRALPDHARSDIFEDVVWNGVLGPIGLSPTAHATRRSYDAARQPFFGWGLTLLPNDIARLARFLGEQHGRIGGHEVLDAGLYAAAMQRDPAQPGLPVATLDRYRYQHGFWARNVQQELGCAQPTWVPFMSGFGGITVVMFPNGAAWYNVADDGELASIDFAAPAKEAAKFGNYCR